MSRKPAHLEMIGGKSPRQRVWEAIRKNRDSFTQIDVARASRTGEGIVQDYIKALSKAGFVAVLSEIVVKKICHQRTYHLVRDNGLEAPRVTKNGEEVTQGCINEAMWGTLRRMFKTDAVDYRQLAAFASTASTTVPVASAKVYMQALAAAGYLECVQRSVQGKKAAPARYRLLARMESGARAPMIQRTKRVFDPNWNKVVWTEEKEIDDEQ